MVLREALALQVQKVQVRLRVVPAQAAGPELLIMDAPTKAGAEKALGAFVAEFETKYPTACRRKAAGPLCLSGGALAAPTDVESDRVAVRDGSAATASDRRSARVWLNGVQAA